VRRDYLVAYDICDPARLRRVYQIMRGFGDHLQYSVFRCAMTHRERVQLVAKLSEVIHHRQDQVMLVDLGGVSPRSRRRFRTLACPWSTPNASLSCSELFDNNIRASRSVLLQPREALDSREIPHFTGLFVPDPWRDQPADGEYCTHAKWLLATCHSNPGWS